VGLQAAARARAGDERLDAKPILTVQAELDDGDDGDCVLRDARKVLELRELDRTRVSVSSRSQDDPCT
jgi:hypothetical protein